MNIYKNMFIRLKWAILGKSRVQAVRFISSRITSQRLPRRNHMITVI